MKIQITLKEKHLCFLGKFLEDKEIRQWAEVNDQIVAAINTPGIAPDDLCPVQVESSKLIELYTLLGYKQEREASLRNGEMKAMLLPQLDSMKDSTNPDIVQVANEILIELSSIDGGNYAAMEVKEDAFRQWAKALRS